MININELISNISNDDRVAVIGYYGSYADNTNEILSDTDLFIILRGCNNLTIEGIHFQNDKYEEIDFLLISENIIHSSEIPNYIVDCILSKSKILYSNCKICELEIDRLKNEYKSSMTSKQEIENIYWHLRHIIFKAKRYNSNSIEMLILWSKFVYFISLLWPRLHNRKVQGELVFLKADYGKPLVSFLSEKKYDTKNPKSWELFLNSLDVFNEVNNQNIFIEVDGLIQPYTPQYNESSDKIEYRKLINTWLSIKL